jgi:hypothetical protein
MAGYPPLRFLQSRTLPTYSLTRTHDRVHPTFNNAIPTRSSIMLFNRSLSAILALFVLALPVIAMDADVEPLTRREVQEIFDRGQTSCRNDGIIGRDKYDPQYVSCHNIRQLLVPDSSVCSCLPGSSKGKKSSHNCVGIGGKSYLCVLSGKATCYTSNLKNLNMENGECFT